jgi:hypothetical protein
MQAPWQQNHRAPGRIAKGYDAHRSFLAIQYRETLLIARAFSLRRSGLIVKNAPISR